MPLDAQRVQVHRVCKKSTSYLQFASLNRRNLDIMPHSTASDEAPPPAPAEEDTVLSDAPPQSPDKLREEEGNNAGEKVLHVDDSTRPVSRIDVKLEDLFDDADDDDEEFPSSGVANGNVDGTPPTAPM